MIRQYNFSAGPAMLPAEVLEQAAKEMKDWKGSGISVMEMSHRSEAYQSIAEQAEADLRELYSIPNNYKVLFLQGGASSQFAMVPMNLLCNRQRMRADYINTGVWSQKAIDEASKYCEVNIAASSESSHFTTIPERSTWNLKENAAYVHYTPNETIGGVEFHDIPDVGDKPLIADMSSTILSRPTDISRYGIIYAGAQKNIGAAGLTIVIIRDDLLTPSLIDVPAMFDYSIHAKAGSMYNTPPTYAWYLSGLVFKWLKAKGGLKRIAEINKRKAQHLYQTLDQSDFYTSPVPKAFRSLMNVPFTLADNQLDTLFLEQAKEAGLLTLKGHRSVGGMRASIYNAMPEEGVLRLVRFMKEFEQMNG